MTLKSSWQTFEKRVYIKVLLFNRVETIGPKREIALNEKSFLLTQYFQRRQHDSSRTCWKGLNDEQWGY